jgi:tetratricopeptide (TPR) repeat protein
MNFNDFVSQGNAFFKKGEPEKALENYRAALELNPDNPHLREMIRSAEMSAHARKQACQAAENEAKSRAEAFNIDIKDVDKIITELNEELKFKPFDIEVKNVLAMVYYIRGLTFTSKGENSRAIVDYNNAIKYKPDFLLAIKRRSSTYLNNTKDFDNAISDYMELIRLDPTNNDKYESFLANAYFQRANDYYDKNDYDHAIQDYEKALKLEPSNSTALELLKMAKADKAKQ